MKAMPGTTSVTSTTPSTPMLLRASLPLAAFVFASCGGETVYQPVRLADHLDEATVASPLRDVTAVSSTAELSSLVHAEEIWRASLANVNTQERCHFNEGDLAIFCSSGRLRFPPVPVEPQTPYRVRYRTLREKTGCFRSSVTEHSKTQALRIHEGRVPEVGTWSTEEAYLLTTPETQELEVLFRLCRGWLSDLIVERLELTSEQELALLKGSNIVPAADPALGLLKRGRLLPLSDPETVVSPHDTNYIVRDAFFAPAPTDLSFDLRIARGAQLRFSYAMARESRPGDTAGFSVLVEPRGGVEKILWRESLRVGTDISSWYWYDETVDLTEFQGRDVRLTLRTRSGFEDDKAQRGYALWGNPLIDVPSKALASAPNVILIAVDTLRADRLSCYGHEVETSPNIDQLARDGVLFDQVSSSFATTRPSFSSLMTGNGAVDSPPGIPMGRKTLASSFRAAGWATAGIVYKAYLYSGGYDQGFDEFFNVPRFRVRAEDNVDRAISWLGRNQHRRFFLFLHLNDPHQPFCQPRETLPADLEKRLSEFGMTLPVSISKNRVSGQSTDSKETETMRSCRDCVKKSPARERFQAVSRDVYDHAITYADNQIGAFLNELRRRNLYDDAVIAFVSDHGESLWREDSYGHNGPDLYDDVTRVPLIIKPPKSSALAEGKVIDGQVRHYDLMPTLLELASIDPGDMDVDGQSLVTALKQSPGQSWWSRHSWWPQKNLEIDSEENIDRVAVMLRRGAHMAAVRHRGWKYISQFKGPTNEQLFDIREDPGELRNMADERPRIARAMRLKLFEALLESRSGQVILVTGAPPPGGYAIEVTFDQAPVIRRSIAFPEPIYSVKPQPQEKSLSGKSVTSVSPREDDAQKPREVSNFRFEGQATDRLLLLARFDAPAGSVFDVTMLISGEPPRLLARNRRIEDANAYKVGDLARWLRMRDDKVLVVQGRGPSEAVASESTADARQLEALRALGYID